MIAATSGGEQLVAFLFLGGVVAVCLIYSALRGPAHYDLNYKGGAPYCPRCNRQVSLRRDHCRACGYAFISYPGHAPGPPKPFIDPAIGELAKIVAVGVGTILATISTAAIIVLNGIGRLLSLRWIAGLPEWAQPIAWGAVIPIPPIALFIIARAILAHARS